LVSSTIEKPVRMSWIDRGREFVKDVRAEVGKVSWPTRAELRDSTMVVIATVFIVAIYIGVIDRIISLIIGLLFR
jgi:preprotein translocase subunit SecE